MSGLIQVKCGRPARGSAQALITPSKRGIEGHARTACAAAGAAAVFDDVERLRKSRPCAPAAPTISAVRYGRAEKDPWHRRASSVGTLRSVQMPARPSGWGKACRDRAARRAGAQTGIMLGEQAERRRHPVEPRRLQAPQADRAPSAAACLPSGSSAPLCATDGGRAATRSRLPVDQSHAVLRLRR